MTVRNTMSAKAIELTTQKNLMCVAFKPDGVVVGADKSGAIRQWSISDVGVEVGGLAMKFNGIVYATVVSADGKWIVTSGSGRSVVVWSALTHQQVLEVADHDTHTSFVCAVDVSSDSRLFASGSHDKTARIFDITSGARLITPLLHNTSVIGVRFSPDTNRIATATQNYPCGGVYDTYSGDKLFEISVGVGPGWAGTTPLAWSADGQQLFAASQGKISCLDTSTFSRSEWPIHDSNGQQVSIVTNSKFIACSAGSSVSFWDPSSRKEITRINHTALVTCIAISCDGRHLACGHSTGITVHTLQELLPELYLHALDSPSVSRLPLMRVRETVLQSLIAGNPIETESVLSDEIAESSNPSHEALATRAIIRAHLGEWKTATEDAEMSLKIKRSPIGQIAKSVGPAGIGQEEAALEEFDLTFHSCNPNDIELLLVIKSILAFVCNKRQEAISRLRSLVNGVVGETSGGYHFQVLGNMYLKQGNYEDAVRTLGLVKASFTPDERGPLMTIHIIFNWNFQNLESVAWQRLCETLYSSGSIKEIGETLQKMVAPLPENEREAAHGHILQEIIRRSGEVTLLAWTGESSKCNSCLPKSPAVYGQTALVPPSLGAEELERRTTELRTVFSLIDAVATYRCITRLQPARFTHFRLLLPCIVFRVRRLRREQGNVYRAEAVALGDVDFTTEESLPLKEVRRLVLVNPWIHLLREDRGRITWEGDSSDSDAESNTDDGDAAEVDVELVHASMIEEAPTNPSTTNMYTQALELIARLGQPFSALLLLKQPDGAYRRVAADHEIAIRGMGSEVPRDIRIEVLEVV
ncbi:hypothetical protein JVU11DRAFT_10334 [Chiua virens]|nr:hypothetical protein JVU11DRAFT_10334 [Chiua virens]